MRALLCVFFVVASCANTTEVDSQVTIGQGLYGQLRQRCTGADCVGAPRVGTPVAFFDQDPYRANDGGTPAPRAQTTSDRNGFYELSLESNVRGYLALGDEHPTLGRVWFTSTAVTVPRGLGRLDWTAGADNAGTWLTVK